MDYTSLKDLRAAVSQGGERIRWAGSTALGNFTVLTVDDAKCTKRYVCTPLSWAPDVKPVEVLSFVESNPRLRSAISISPEDSTSMAESRRAAVFGVNIGGDCTSGACKKYNGMEGCTLSYDIETSMKDVREGGFGLIDEEMLSIAAKCSCSAGFYVDRALAASSSELTSRFIAFVLDHMPMWLVGWNCYTFDNECMRYWCSDSLKDINSQYLYSILDTRHLQQPRLWHLGTV